jgi:tetratricopeptide (TPR) repeat protein
VLSNQERRGQYDESLVFEKQMKKQRAERAAAAPRQQPTASARLAELKLDLNRLNTLFSRGNYYEAEKLAKSVLSRDQRQPVPYAVLGDLARMAGDKKEAGRLYALAIQYDPRNPAYRQRYDDLVEWAAPAPRPAGRPVDRREEVKQGQMYAPLFGLGIILIACMYIIFARETPMARNVSLISTWTVGLIVMLFLSGVVLGSSMAVDNLLESFQSMGRNLQGRSSPAVALATIAIVSFWAAAAIYVLFGLTRKAFNNTTSRLIACVIAGTALLALASEATGTISGFQVFVWGGNIVYVGAICGWMVTDALKSST